MKTFKEFSFEAAHLLPDVPADHKCARLHGHSFTVKISVEGHVEEKSGWVMDFADISSAFKPIRKELDHYYLNEIEGLENPTSEVMVEWIWKRLAPELPGLCKLVLWENKRSRVEFCG